MIPKYLAYLHQFQLYLRCKLAEKTLPLLHRAITAVQPTAFDLTKSHRLNLGRPDRVVILLVGCGGTGSFSAHILAQLASWAATSGLDLRLYFIDPDQVEEKNLVRQNFCQAELGQPKAFTLAWRYSAAFGLNITPVVDRFSPQMLERFKPGHSLSGTLTIVVGAVDNFQARRDIAEVMTARLNGQFGYVSPRDRLWWLDAGNERVSGQVLIGNSLEPEPLLSPLGFCTDLPLPHLQEPTLLARPDPPAVEPLSCAELTVLEEQSAMINRVMATWLGVYLYRLLQSRDLDLMATYLNLRTGAVRSTPITTGRVVLPEGIYPRLVPPTELTPEPLNEAICPVCGGAIIQGYDEFEGIRIGVRFCAQCDLREEACPRCGGELVETDLELEGQIVPGLACETCDWAEPISAEYRQALAEAAHELP